MWHSLSFCSRLLAVCLLLMGVAACRSVDKGEVAAQAAKAYYDHLRHGQVEDYVAGIWQPDSIPESYRLQLADNARMFLAQMKTEHKGIRELAANGGTYDEAAGTAQAFLYITFGDGDTEQIVVPMIEVGGIWYLR